MMLWVVLALMTAAAVFAVLWPLSRRDAQIVSGSDIAVYRDQLDEVGRDAAAGLIGKAEADAARIEISRRLLAAADAADGAPIAAASALWRRRAAATVALAGLPALALGLYLSLGSPNLPGAPVSARNALPLEQRSIESMVAQVEAHLERNPNDGQGWEVLAPVYMRLGRFNDAVKARHNALRLLGATPARESDLGEALTGAANGVVTADARAAFERALKLDADDVKGRFFIGLAAEQDGRSGEAAKIWTALLARTPPDAPYRILIMQSLARVRPQTPQPGPTAEDMAAAETMPADERAQMIRGMVDRLAARLKDDASDLDGWLRLVRAYMVLGETDKAKDAAANARKALDGDAEKRRQLDETVRGLGIEG